MSVSKGKDNVIEAKRLYHIENIHEFHFEH